MDKWLNPEASATEIVSEPTPSGDDDEAPFPTSTVVTSQAKSVQSPSTAKAKGKDSVDQAFDDLFNS
jgi:hypothetical protein